MITIILIIINQGKINRRIRLGSDGNLYHGDELISTTTEKEKAVLQELEGGTAKVNNIISTTRETGSGSNSGSNSGSGGGGVGVRSGNSLSGIRVTTEGGVGTAIDENASVSKQTIQALRYLFKAGR